MPVVGARAGARRIAEGRQAGAGAMGDERPVDDFRWPWAVRPRRLNIGDLLFLVGLAALVAFAMSLVLRSELDDGHRAAFGVLALLLLAMEAAQWGLGGLPADDPRSRRELWMGVVSYLLAMAMFVVLLALAALFPDGAAIVVLILVIAGLYLSTWE